MNLMKAIAIVLCIITIAVVAVYLMGQFEQTRPYYDNIIGYVDKAKTWATENWIVMSGSIGTLATVGGVAYSKVKDAKNKVSEVTNSAQSKINSLTSEKEKIAAAVQSVTQRAEIAENEVLQMKETYANFGNILGAKEEALTNANNTIANLRAQIEGLSKQNVDNLADQVSTAIAEKTRVG